MAVLSRTVAISALLFAGEHLGAGGLTLSLQPASEGVRCSIAQITVTGADGRKETLVQGPLSVDGIRSIDLTRSIGTLRIESSDCWSEPVRLPDHMVRLWPVASVIGAVVSGTPKEIHATFVDARKQESTEHAVDCAITGRTWRCTVPARRPMHLAVTIDDFTPIYVWDFEARDAVFDTGTHALMRGAGLVGRVLSSTGDPVANASLTLTRTTAAHQASAERRIGALHARSNAKGQFQFNGVPPGRYRLQSTAEGFGDAVREVGDLDAGQSARLSEALVHSPIAGVEIFLIPPVSRSGRPWRVLLSRSGEKKFERSRVAEGPAGVNGLWTARDLQPATYEVVVADREAEVAQTTIELHGGLERVSIAISTIEIRGRVLSGGKGTKATAQFDLNTRRVRVTTDDDGSFEASFPVPGNWETTVSADGVKGEVRLPPTAIVAAQEKELVLEIPGGRISGSVVDERGRPAPAAVRVKRDGRTIAQSLTDDAGKFDLHGLGGGGYFLEADADDGYAGPVAVTLVEDEPHEIELRVEALRDVNGQVLGADGAPASGAVVRVVDPSTGAFEDTIADGRGLYSFRAKPAAAFIDIVVIAPPYPIALRRFPIVAKRTTSLAPIQLIAGGGTLLLHPRNIPPWPVVRTADGRSYSLALLVAPRFGEPRMRELVSDGLQFFIEPGMYHLCVDGTDCRSAPMSANAVTTVDFWSSSKGEG